MLCSCLYIQTVETDTSGALGCRSNQHPRKHYPSFLRPSTWMNPNFSNGHIFRILSYGRDVGKGNKNSMKISVLSMHHPSTVVLSCVAGSLWLEPWDQELNEKLCPVQVSSIHCCAFVRDGCLFTLHTGHSRVKCVSLKKRRFRHYRQ
jgi:hypothetical protein